MANDNIEFEEDDILLDSNRPAISSPQESGLQKALPYIGMALSASRAMRSGDAAGAGLSIISGLSNIKNMQVAGAKEKDRATKAGIEIKEMKKNQALLDKKEDFTLTTRFGKLTEGQKEIFLEEYKKYADENNMITNRARGQLEKDLKQNNAFMTSITKAGDLDRKNDAQVALDKSLKIGQTKGFDSPEYQASKKEADMIAKRYNDGVVAGEAMLTATARYNKRIEDLSKWATPESIEAYIAGTGKLKPLAKASESKPEMTPTEALGKIAQAQKAKESFLTTGGVNPIVMNMISRDNPELAKIMQGSADKESVSEAFDKYIESLKQFTGGSENDPLKIL